MADFQGTNIRPVAENSAADITITHLSLDIESRPHTNGNDNQEQYRWVARVVMYQDYKNVTIPFDVVGSVPESENGLDGSINGGDATTIKLVGGTAWENARWYMINEAILAASDPGSQMARHQQTWIAATAWADAPWEA